MNALIFSHQRCGSSNMLRFIGQAFQVPAALEVFNAKGLTKRFPTWREASPEALVSYFERTLSRYRVVKHIYGKHDPAMDELIAATPGAKAILFLYRQNAHASALSTLIARRIQNFGERASMPIGRIPVEDIDRLVKTIRAKRHSAIDHCLHSGRPVLSMPYEYIFANDMHIRKDRAQTVIDFLEQATGLSASNQNFEEAFDAFLGVNKKINSWETYQFIENLTEIAERFPETFK